MNYFIDTNIIIDILNKKIDPELKELLEDEKNTFFINRLVLIESLRTIPLMNTNIFNKAKSSLELFKELDITPKICKETIDFSRFLKNKHLSIKGKCEAIDLIHFITAKYYNLEIITNDKDFKKLEDIYQEYKEENIACLK